MLRDILEDRTTPPAEPVKTLVHAFLRSECEEATIRMALNHAAPFYRNAPEAVDAHAECVHILEACLREKAPRAGSRRPR